MFIIIILLIIIIIILCPSLLGIPVYAIAAIISIIKDLIVPISIYAASMIIMYIIGWVTYGKFRMVRIILSLILAISITAIINFNGMFLLSYILLFSLLVLITNQELIFLEMRDSDDDCSDDTIAYILGVILLYFVALIFIYELRFSLSDNIDEICLRGIPGGITKLLTLLVFPFILLVTFGLSIFMKKWFIPIFIIIGLFSGNYLYKSYPKIKRYMMEREINQRYDPPKNTIKYEENKGKYENTRNKSYQGSKQQKDDLEKIDKYMNDHPDF